MELKFADEKSYKEGWTLCPSFLREIQKQIERHDDCPSLEGIEIVLLAYENKLND
jgi:hypothetical protein